MIKHITLTTIAILTIFLTALIFMLPVPARNTSEAKADLTLVNVRIVQDGELSAPQSIQIMDGMISDIGFNLTTKGKVVDGQGLTAMPGLIDSHTHSYGTALEDAPRFGVTLNVDMFSDVSAIKAAKAARAGNSQTGIADLWSAGMMATAPGGHGTQYGIAIETLTQPEQAKSWVAARKAEGSDFIKIVYMPGQTRIPSISRDIARALIAAAHEQDLLAVAHISTQSAAKDVIEDGIDGLVHIFADVPVSDAVVALAKDKQIFIIPTLSVIASVDGRPNAKQISKIQTVASNLSPMQSQTLNMTFPGKVPGFSFDIALENVRRFHKAGVPILAGSDAPNPGTAHGISLHQELQHLVQAGLTPAQALDAATRLPAKVFALPSRGTIKKGSKADILLIEGNPLQDITATLALQTVLKNGNLIERSTAPKQSGTALNDGLLGDFESAPSSQSQLMWSQTSDAMANGKSTAKVERVKSEMPSPSPHALKVTGRINPGFPYPWAGANIGASQNSTGYDISGFETVTFSVKGTPGSYRVMAFAAGNMGIPPAQNFQITPNWQQVSLPIDGFTGFNPKAFVGFAFVAGAPGDFEFHLDDVILE